jgi:hypothetical protein
MNRRTLFAALAFALVAPGAAQAAPKPPAQVTKIEVLNLIPVGNQLIANAIVTLKVAGKNVTQFVQFPVGLAGLPNPNGPCDILNLSLGPINLDLLGLVVNLDDCAGGPVTVDVTANPAGGLLGTLLCDVAGLLNGGIDLNGLLASLTTKELATLETGLVKLINEVLHQALDKGVAVTPPATPGTCPILHLQIPDGLHLNLLGLHVDTSAICLDVSAEMGPGNLLGNLLCDVVNLLNSPGNNNHAIDALLKTISQLIKALGL